MELVGIVLSGEIQSQNVLDRMFRLVDKDKDTLSADFKMLHARTMMSLWHLFKLAILVGY